MPMDLKSTQCFFQYTYFAGKEHFYFIDSVFSFDYDYWFAQKINSLIDSAPELPDDTIKMILKKAKVC
jgi:hypothetical protein